MRAAETLNRYLAVVPGPVDTEAFQGSNAWLNVEGVSIIVQPEDSLGLLTTRKEVTAPPADLTDDEIRNLGRAVQRDGRHRHHCGALASADYAMPRRDHHVGIGRPRCLWRDRRSAANLTVATRLERSPDNAAGVVRPRHVYVHVPFCARRCSYCDFSIAVRRHVPVARYLTGVADELEARFPMRLGSWHADTIYLGGGTPSLLAAEGVERLMAVLRTRITLAPEC